MMMNRRIEKGLAILWLIFQINMYGQDKHLPSEKWIPTPIVNTEYNDLEWHLSELPGITFKQLDSSARFPSTYQINVKQAIDHHDESKGSFYQKIYLTHKGFDRPTVMITEGYSMWENSAWDIVKLLGANQIKVEHRYYGKSKPDSIDYNYLGFEQAAADYHYVRQLFGRIYKGKWISTGHSKGGVAAIVHRYFYPDDIAVCIPNAAPIIISNYDLRFVEFMDTVFSNDCLERIKSLQIRLLENRERVLPLLEIYALGAKLEFNYLTLEQAFEYGVLEYPSCLLEYGDCEEIPDDAESIPGIVKHFLTVQKFHWFSDQYLNSSSSFFYQRNSEMGGYAYETENVEHLLTAIDPKAAIAPYDSPVIYNGNLMNDVYKWLASQGHRFIYLYGGRDYWSAAAVPPNDSIDSEWFFLKDKRHLETDISGMTDMQRKNMISILENWLSLEIKDVFQNK